MSKIQLKTYLVAQKNWLESSADRIPQKTHTAPIWCWLEASLSSSSITKSAWILILESNCYQRAGTAGNEQSRSYFSVLSTLFKDDQEILGNTIFKEGIYTWSLHVNLDTCPQNHHQRVFLLAKILNAAWWLWIITGHNLWSLQTNIHLSSLFTMFSIVF